MWHGHRNFWTRLPGDNTDVPTDQNEIKYNKNTQNGPGYSDPLHVCGMCGMLFETSFPLGAHLL